MKLLETTLPGTSVQTFLSDKLFSQGPFTVNGVPVISKSGETNFVVPAIFMIDGLQEL